MRRDGCIPCPPGRYGSHTHLTTSTMCPKCPRGTYLGACFMSNRPGLPLPGFQLTTYGLDVAGGIIADDCRPCPRGTYGDTEGLASRECSGRCSDLNTAKTKYYGGSEGLLSKSGCRVCPQGYLDVQAQCKNKKLFLDLYAGGLRRFE